MVPRTGHASVVINDQVYIIGGVTEDRRDTNSVEVMETNQWREVSSLNQRRSIHSACPIGQNFIFVHGGSDDYAKPLSSIERYDISKDTWELLSIKLPQPV